MKLSQTMAPSICTSACAFMAVAMLMPPALRADDAEPDATGYDAAIATALDRYAARDWAGARAAFERAHALRPGARTLRGVALSAYYAGDYVAACRAFEQALAEGRHPLSPEQRAQARDLLARTYHHIGQLRVRAVPQGSVIRLAGQAIANDEPLVLVPGSYSIEVEFAGHRPHVQQIALNPGQQLSLYIELQSVPAPAPAATFAGARAEPARGSHVRSGADVVPPPQPPPARAAPWVAAGATVAVSASAAIFAVLAEEELDSLRDRCRRAAACDAYTRAGLWADSPIETYETLVNVSLVAAAAGAIATAVLFLLDGEASADLAAGTSIEARPTQNGLRLRATF